MNHELLVRADAASGEVTVTFGNGPFYVLNADGQVTERYTDPLGVEPMCTLDDAVNDVLALIADVEISTKTAKAIAAKLGVSPEDVGRAPVRKPRTGAA